MDSLCEQSSFSEMKVDQGSTTDKRKLSRKGPILSAARPCVFATYLVATFLAFYSTADGSEAVVIRSDSSWKCAIQVPSDWSCLGFDDTSWKYAESPNRNVWDKISGPWNLDPGAVPMWHPDNPKIAYFRKTFELDGFCRAPSILHICVDDDYELHVNGQLVKNNANGYLTFPGESYNVTPYLRKGKNLVAIKGIDRIGGRSVHLSLKVSVVSAEELVELQTKQERYTRIALALLGVFGVLLAGAVACVVRRLQWKRVWKLARDTAVKLCDVPRSVSFWLFLLALLLLGCFVNTADQGAYNLMHAGVESIVERGTFHLSNSSTPEFQRIGDVISHRNGRRYAIKPPGIFLLGAVSYFPLHRLFGLSYLEDYDVVAVLVTFFSTTLLTAISVALIYRFAEQIGASRFGAVCVAATYGFGTIAYAYAGVLHHDQCGAFFYLAAFYFAFQTFHCKQQHRVYPLLAGLFLGFGPLFSVMGVLAGICIGLYVLSFLQGRSIVLFLVGMAIGIVPFVAINWWHFGGPFTTVHQLGFARDVTPILAEGGLRWGVFMRRVHLYFTNPTSGLLFYSPVLLLSVPGVLFFARGYVRERLAITAAVCLSYAYLTTVCGMIGESQFGTRMILSFLPLLCLTLCPYWAKSGHGLLARWWWQSLFLLLLVPSIVFCGLGASVTTMFNHWGRWNAWYVYLRIALGSPFPTGLPYYEFSEYPLRPALLFLSVPVVCVLAWRLLVLRRKENAL